MPGTTEDGIYAAAPGGQWVLHRWALFIRTRLRESVHTCQFLQSLRSCAYLPMDHARISPQTLEFYRLTICNNILKYDDVVAAGGVIDV